LFSATGSGAVSVIANLLLAGVPKNEKAAQPAVGKILAEAADLK
jgi:hypothetical protein